MAQHLWRSWVSGSGCEIFNTWCGRRLARPELGETATLWGGDDLTSVDCLHCLAAARDRSMRQAALAAQEAADLTDRLESVRRARSRRRNRRARKRGA